MTTFHRSALKLAAKIILEEMEAKGFVSIPGLGKFYTGSVTCREGIPKGLPGGDKPQDRQEFLQTVPRFRAYRRLKEVVHQRKYL